MTIHRPRISIIPKIICRFTRSSSDYRGKQKIIKWLLRNKGLFRSIKPQRVFIKDVGKMELIPNDFVDKYLFITGSYEKEVVDKFTAILQLNDNVIDVGANIGYFSLLASKLVGTNGMVFSFEVSPPILSRLKRNIQINSIENIVIFPFAVSNKVGSAEFYISENMNSGLSSLRSIDGTSHILVDTMTLDSVLDRLPKIKVIKMDIEGAEGMALEGMVKLLNRDRPHILMELTDSFLRQLGSRADDLVGRLQELNYEVTDCNGTVIDLKSTPIQQCNIYCSPMNN